MKPKTVLLWGDTQVGKTCLLTTAFFGELQSRISAVDRTASAEQLNQTLLPHWSGLKKNRWVEATSEEHIDLDLKLKNGDEIQIRDVKGGLVSQAHQKAVAKRLSDASAVLFLVEWHSSRIGEQCLAIEAAWALTEGRPRALVFTKAERELSRNDPVWRKADGWVEAHGWLEERRPLIELFGDAVFITSAYGYNRRTQLPASVLGEYGDVFPYDVEPLHVADPFEWVLREIGYG